MQQAAVTVSVPQKRVRFNNVPQVSASEQRRSPRLAKKEHSVNASLSEVAVEQGSLPVIDCSAGFLTGPLVQKPSIKKAKTDIPSALTPEAVDFVKWHSGRAAAAIEAAEQPTTRMIEARIEGDNNITDPKSRKAAMKSTNAAKWMEAEQAELRGMMEKKVWEEVNVSEVPKGAKIIPSKWLYKVKRSATGQIERFKARLVACGNFVGDTEVDFTDIKSNVVRIASVRLLFSLAASLGLEVDGLDVDQAFLLNGLEKEVFMRKAQGYNSDGKVLRLLKSVYGLREAPMLFEKLVVQWLLEFGFERLQADKCVFKLMSNGRYLIIGIYVDDMIILHRGNGDRDWFVAKMREKTAIKDLGKMKTVLGMNIAREDDGSITLSHPAVVDELLSTAGLTDSRPTSTPLVPNAELMTPEGEPDAEEKATMSMAPFCNFRSLIGSLLYLASTTRPDIAFAVTSLSRFMTNPRLDHWRALVHLLRYLKGTKLLGITYASSALQNRIRVTSSGDYLMSPESDDVTASFHNILVAFSDADWAAEMPGRRSRTGYVIFLNGGPIAWSCRLQPTPSLSTCEAEFFAMCETARELKRLQMLLNELGFLQPPKPYVKDVGDTSIKNTGSIIFGDNISAVAVGKQIGFSSKTRHLDIRLQFLQDWVQKGIVSLVYCPTRFMIADILTKVPGPIIFNLLRPRLMGRWIYQVLSNGSKE